MGDTRYSGRHSVPHVSRETCGLPAACSTRCQLPDAGIQRFRRRAAILALRHFPARGRRRECPLGRTAPSDARWWGRVCFTWNISTPAVVSGVPPPDGLRRLGRGPQQSEGAPPSRPCRLGRDRWHGATRARLRGRFRTTMSAVRHVSRETWPTGSDSRACNPRLRTCAHRAFGRV